MNNNTLIAGFEDIMTHIKNQEIRIKKLTAAKDEADKLYYTEYNGKTYEPWELKEENEGLKKQLETMAECNDAGMLCDDNGDCIHNLKKENEKLKNTLDVWENPTGRTFVEEIQKLKKENEKLKAAEAKIDELEEETTPLTVSGPHRILQEKNDKLTKELVTVHEYLWSKDAAVWQTRMTKDIIMNLMIKIIKELCDEDSVDIEKEWQADTRGVKWTDKNYNDFMINICKEMDDDNWNDFGGISLQWKDDTLYFRRVEP